MCVIMLVFVQHRRICKGNLQFLAVMEVSPTQSMKHMNEAVGPTPHPAMPAVYCLMVGYELLTDLQRMAKESAKDVSCFLQSRGVFMCLFRVDLVFA